MENILWSGEAHFHPQTFFLLDGKLEYFPFDYLGELGHLDEILQAVLMEFAPSVSDRPLARNIRSYRKRERDKDYLQDYNIQREQLTDADIANICKIYWIDYICFPFDVPSQCNLTQIFEEHYDKH